MIPDKTFKRVRIKRLGQKTDNAISRCDIGFDLTRMAGHQNAGGACPVCRRHMLIDLVDQGKPGQPGHLYIRDENANFRAGREQIKSLSRRVGSARRQAAAHQKFTKLIRTIVFVVDKQNLGIACIHHNHLPRRSIGWHCHATRLPR